MAKALFGHVGIADPRAARMQQEMSRLRARVADLEAALERESRATSALQRRLEQLDSMDRDQILTIDSGDLLALEREPALA